MTHRATHGEVNIRRNKRGRAPKVAAGRAGHPSAPVYGKSSTGLDGGEHGAWSHELREEVSIKWGECSCEFPCHGQVCITQTRSQMDFLTLQPADLPPAWVEHSRASICGPGADAVRRQQMMLSGCGSDG